MAGPAHTATSPGSEYQHFVPQFMLRNFAHKYVGPQRTKKGNKKGKKKNETMFRGELVVNNVNLKADPIAIEETKVSRILGMYDMYQDTSRSNTAQQRQIETMFGNLESHVSTILKRIVKAFEAGDPNAWVTREERNSIRKFLFILKYRGSTFHQRFHHETSDAYDANDKELLEKYMKENNMKRPVDVWYHGLKTIMNLKTDTEDWKQELVRSMYPHDAMWFIMHSEMMYMSICTPAEPDNEFILTDNSYNVFEGPNTFSTDPLTGKVTESGWTNFHEFAPLSPKLMIVLRSHILPVPEEDCYPEMKAEREGWRKRAVDDHYGTAQQSSLADLPITKPRNNYSRLVNGRVEFLPGEDGAKSKAHRFCFSFFPVGTKHVNKINHILFDNAYRCTNIVFGSRDVFTRTLEWYMTNDSKLGKSVMGNSPEARRKLLVSLAALMKSLGSELEPVWTEIPDDIVSEFDRMKTLYQSLRKGLADGMLEGQKELQDNPQPPQGPKYAFLRLGGTDETFFEDMEFSNRMLKRRIKVDVRSKGQPEAVRAQLREELIEEYLTYRPTRVLFFVQQVRLMVLKHDEEYLQGLLESSGDSPENIIAQALHDKMTPENINRLMYKAAMNDIERVQYPFEDRNFWSTPIPSPEGALHLRLVRKMVFDLPGQLKKCGVPKVAALAEAQEKRIRQQGIGKVKGIPFSFIDDDMKIELATRAMAKSKFQETLAGDVEASLLQKLEDVIFKATYPTPPVRSPT